MLNVKLNLKKVYIKKICIKNNGDLNDNDLFFLFLILVDDYLMIFKYVLKLI